MYCVQNYCHLRSDSSFPAIFHCVWICFSIVLIMKLKDGLEIYATVMENLYVGLLGILHFLNIFSYIT
jgi:hypothetical protein